MKKWEITFAGIDKQPRDNTAQWCRLNIQVKDTPKSLFDIVVSVYGTADWNDDFKPIFLRIALQRIKEELQSGELPPQNYNPNDKSPQIDITEQFWNDVKINSSKHCEFQIG